MHLVVRRVEDMEQAAFSFECCLCSCVVPKLKMRVPPGGMLLQATRYIVICPSDVMNVEGAVFVFSEGISSRRSFRDVG